MGTKMRVKTSLRYEVKLNNILDFIGENNPKNEWGCFEFKDDAIDIEPNTLYKYCDTHNQP